MSSLFRSIASFLVVGIICLFLIVPLYAFLSIAHEGVTPITSEGVVVGDNYGPDFGYEELLDTTYQGNHDYFGNTWKALKKVTHKMLDTAYLVAHGFGYPGKGDAEHGKPTPTVPLISVLFSTLIDDDAINVLAIKYGIDVDTLDLGGDSWDEASNATKLLAIYSHPKYKAATELLNTSVYDAFIDLFSFDDYITDDSVIGNFFDWVSDNSIIGSLFK